MKKIEEKMEKLEMLVKGGREYCQQSDDLALGYVTGFVAPALEDVLKAKCCEIEKRHRLDDAKGGENFVIHYTSIDTLVSMLQNAAKNKQDASKDEQKSSQDEKDSSLRLYDSVHFNDPDEGNYFVRNLNLPKKYNWLNKKNLPHAYIASFIIPDREKNMSDNLALWRTYGREGEGCSLSLHIPSNQLRKVLYGADEVKCTGRLLRPVLDSLSPLVSILKQSIREDIREKLAETIWKSLEGIRYLYKSEAYDYERECRFVIPELDTVEDEICFEYHQQNNAPTRIRHYYENKHLKTQNILVTGSLITLGPCVPYPHNMRYYLGALMRKAGLLGPEIKISEIPYRKP